MNISNTVAWTLRVRVVNHLPLPVAYADSQRLRYYSTTPAAE